MDVTRFERDVFTIEEGWTYEDYVAKMKGTVDKMMADTRDTVMAEPFRNVLRRLELTGIEVKEQTVKQRWDWVYFFSYKYVIQLLDHVRQHKRYKQDMTKADQEKANRIAGEAMHNVETYMDGYLESFFKQRQAKQHAANVQTAATYTAALRKRFAESPHRGLAPLALEGHNPSLYASVVQACLSIPTFARECIRAAKAQRALAAAPPAEGAAAKAPPPSLLAGLGEVYIQLHSPPTVEPGNVGSIVLKGKSTDPIPVDPGVRVPGALVQQLESQVPADVLGASGVLGHLVQQLGALGDEFFAFHSQNLILCPKCGAASPQHTALRTLTLTVPAGRAVRLEDMLVQQGYHGAGTPLQLTDNWACNGCGLQIPCLQTVKAKASALAVAPADPAAAPAAAGVRSQPPRVLAVVLNRFDERGERVDGASEATPQPGGVWIPAGLNLQPFTAFVGVEQKGEVRYKLRSAVSHSGASLAAGAYTAIGLRPPPVGTAAPNSPHIWVTFEGATAAAAGKEDSAGARNILAAASSAAVLLLYELVAFQPGAGAPPPPGVQFNNTPDVKHHDPAAPPGGAPQPQGPDLAAMRQQLMSGGLGGGGVAVTGLPTGPAAAPAPRGPTGPSLTGMPAAPTGPAPSGPPAPVPAEKGDDLAQLIGAPAGMPSGPAGQAPSKPPAPPASDADFLAQLGIGGATPAPGGSASPGDTAPPAPQTAPAGPAEGVAPARQPTPPGPAGVPPPPPDDDFLTQLGLAPAPTAAPAQQAQQNAALNAEDKRLQQLEEQQRQLQLKQQQQQQLEEQQRQLQLKQQQQQQLEEQQRQLQLKQQQQQQLEEQQRQLKQLQEQQAEEQRLKQLEEQKQQQHDTEAGHCVKAPSEPWSIGGDTGVPSTQPPPSTPPPPQEPWSVGGGADHPPSVPPPPTNPPPPPAAEGTSQPPPPPPPPEDGEGAGDMGRTLGAGWEAPPATGQPGQPGGPPIVLN
eukprot:TRINITY_DN969_c0_g1_i5.p1 TRINITY_DN969_c0_g1~~TRINITY_DN969_c0_g1_i5.p1  ORF type:complete len:988 (+),score=247.62 TRINITY_DN969_c0_g1_i5:57-2966(+)